MSNNALLRIGALAGALALIAGCGTSSPKAAPTVKPASLDTLKKIVLQPSDMPAGWAGTPYQADASDAADNAAMAKCLGVRNTEKDKVAEANSDDYALGNAGVSSSASSYKSQSDLDTDIAMLHSTKMSTCFDQFARTKLTSSMPQEAKIDRVSITVTPGSAGGPINVVATGKGTITVTVSHERVSLYLTFAFITGPLIQAEVDTENVGAPVPTSVVNRLVTAVATRAAQGS